MQKNVVIHLLTGLLTRLNFRSERRQHSTSHCSCPGDHLAPTFLPTPEQDSSISFTISTWPKQPRGHGRMAFQLELNFALMGSNTILCYLFPQQHVFENNTHSGHQPSPHYLRQTSTRTLEIILLRNDLCLQLLATNHHLT